MKLSEWFIRRMICFGRDVEFKVYWFFIENKLFISIGPCNFVWLVKLFHFAKVLKRGQGRQFTIYILHFTIHNCAHQPEHRSQ